MATGLARAFFILPLGMILGVPSLAIYLDYLWRLPRWTAYPISLLGAIPLAAAILLNRSAVSAFKRHGEGTPNPFNPPKKVVDVFPYSRSRNPLYLSLLLLYLGVGLLAGSTVLLIAMPIVFLMFHTIIIPWEERRLSRRFGNEYEDYRKRVRRWL